jgi:hypothetical protein
MVFTTAATPASTPRTGTTSGMHVKRPRRALRL